MRLGLPGDGQCVLHRIVIARRSVEPPFTRNPFEYLGTPIFECDPGSVHEVFDGRRHEDLFRIRQRCDSRCDVDRDSTDVVTAPNTLARMQTTANVDADLRHAFGKRGGAQNGSRGAVERRQQPVAGVFDESTLERTDPGTRYLGVAFQ